MAKVSFNSLISTKTVEDRVISFNDKEIAVKQYLPVKSKAELLDTVIQASFDSEGLWSPLRYRIYLLIEKVRWYTNINITDTMLKNLENTYDLFIINGIDRLIDSNVPSDELNTLDNMAKAAIDAINNYSNSFAGQIKSVAADYKNTDFNLEKLMTSLQDPQQVGFVKEVMEKMG